jgi:chemotaxis protein histidine kinase CheA
MAPRSETAMAQVSPHIYQLFITELNQHLSKAHTELFAEVPPSPLEAKEIGRRFHTIRGGAGFLGIEDVADKAAVLDQLLRKSSEQIVENLDKVRETLLELESVAAALPTRSSDT